MGDDSIILEDKFKVNNIASVLNDLDFKTKVVNVVWHRDEEMVESIGVIVKGFESWYKNLPDEYIPSLINKHKDAYVRGLLECFWKTDEGFLFRVFPQNLMISPTELEETYWLQLVWSDEVKIPERMNPSIQGHEVVEAYSVVTITSLVYFAREEGIDRLYSTFGIALG